MTLQDEFVVGGWLVQPSLDRLTRDGTSVHLRPRAMDVLVCLASHAGATVSREKLIDEVWAKEFVSDAALKTAIYELREAFGDRCRSPRVIETIPKRGYRLIAEVVPAPAPEDTRGEIGAAPCVLLYGDRRIPLGIGDTIIGRDPGVAIRIDSIDVSRRHALISVREGQAVIEDLGSKNGTVVAGRRIEAPTELASGDKILIGRTALVFRVVGIPGTTQTASAGDD